jgi:hypothetical protein
MKLKREITNREALHIYKNIWQLEMIEFEDNEEKENFYGEKKKQFFYGNPFVFEGEVLDQQDIFIKIKTKTEIPYNSIIFPKDEFMRWWKVQSYNKESNILLAYPSEEQPSFEELF